MQVALQGFHRMSMVEESAVEVLDTDAQLMLRFKDGDTAAFDQLFCRHTRSVINFAYRFVRHRGMAEELAQEIFLRIYDAAAGYEPQAKFTTWLYRIATNVCLNEIRRKNREDSNIPEERMERIPVYPDSDSRLERQAISRALSMALMQIPDHQRAAFILNKYQEFSYAEVAEAMKISEKAVKSLIHRAKETLAEKLKPLLPELINI